MPDDLAVLQVRQLPVGESERTSQHRPDFRLDADPLRGRDGRATDHEREQSRASDHRLNVMAPALARRSRYSATALRSNGSNSALTASRMSLTVRALLTKFAIS